MLRRRWLCLLVGALTLVPVELVAARPAGAGVETCTTWCVWDQAKFGGNMAELTDGTCKDFPVKSAANNNADTGKAMFFYKQPGCQGKPFNPYGMKAKMQSPHVDAVSAVVKPPTR
jgi:hypothetical protein